MAVFPDRIVLKNSTDSQAAIETAIQTGGTDEITQGEIVLGIENTQVKFYTKSGNGNIVTLGGTAAGANAMGDLTDVDLSTPATNGQILSYNSTSGNWEPVAVGGYTDPLTTDGDIVIRSGGSTTRLAIGSQGEVLRVGVGGVPEWSTTGSGLDNVVEDVTPQLGGDLDVNNNAIISPANTNIVLEAGGTGSVAVRASGADGRLVISSQTGISQVGIQCPSDSAAAAYDLVLPDTLGINGQLLSTDGSGNLGWASPSGLTTWSVTANGTSDYIFSGDGFAGTETDPDLYVVRGQSYLISNLMNAHPFQIQSTQGFGGTAYNDGVTNNGVSNGILSWEVRMDAPSTLYYQCTSHADMNGTIYVLDQGSTVASIDDLSDVDTTTVAPTDGQALVWDAANSQWEPGNTGGSFALDDLSDVDTGVPGQGNVIAYNSISGNWESTAAPPADISGNSINDLSDVDTSTAAPTEGQLLKWNNTDSEWQPGDTSIQAASDFKYADAVFRFDTLSNDTGNFGANYNGPGEAAAEFGTTIFYYEDADGNDLNDAWNPFLNTSVTLLVSTDGINFTQVSRSLSLTIQWVAEGAYAFSGGNLFDASTDSEFYISIVSSGGAAIEDKDLLIWDNTDQAFEPGKLAIDDLSDVDTSTVAPTDGQALLWDNTAQKWEPGTVSGGGGGISRAQATAITLVFS